jgi:hypothetical protein
MKRLFKIALFLGFVLLVQGAHKTARAEGEPICDPGTGYVDYGNDEFADYGFKIIAEKNAPNFPIVIGQDPDQTGVNLSVEIQSLQGKISYESLVYRKECVGYDSYQPGREMESCAPNSGGLFYYWSYVPHCDPTTEFVYRYIDVNSIRVWLDPDSDTEKWLGWSSQAPSGKYPLRDMFPEKWLLGTWTPDGFTGASDPGLWDQGDIDKFVAEHPGFDFLKADPRHETIPSNALLRVMDPMVGSPGEAAPWWTQSPQTEERRVLGLYGSFSAWPGDTRFSTSQAQCLVRMAMVTGGKGECVIDPWNMWTSTLTDLKITFTNAPLDLPGNWRIGVIARVFTTKYNGGTTEKIDDPKFLYMSPDNGYILTAHSFLSYILLTTPCNGLEAGACQQ